MTTMSEIGEKAFLQNLLPLLHTSPNFVNGFGHDASVIDLGLEQYLALKIDRAPFPVALRRGIGDYKTWGRLATAANVSDLLAVGAMPRALMISLVLPETFEVADAKYIVEGCEEACMSHGVAFLGGDTKEGTIAQVVGTALGTVDKNAVFGRGPAKPGDRLFLAGEVGAFAGTLALMDAKVNEYAYSQDWLKVLTHPNAQIKEGRYLRESNAVAAACDLSDGLVDALDIFCSDGAGITVEECLLPLHPNALEASKQSGVPLWRFALGVGDWAIACVVRDKDAERFRLNANSSLLLREIGRFDDSGQKLVREIGGKKRNIPRLINEHFRKRLEDDGSYMHTLLYAK